MSNWQQHCTCGHLGIHHLYESPQPCMALAGDCPCLAFAATPQERSKP